MINRSTTLLSDSELLAETGRVAGCERQSTAELVALLAEVDVRRLYLGLGYSSLFSYCTHVLRLSESAAYARITAARAARSFPGILTGLADGTVTLTTVSLLAGHLTAENREALLDAARDKSRREVESLIANLTAQPDVPTSVRRLPQRHVLTPELTDSPQPDLPTAPLVMTSDAPRAISRSPAPPARAAVVAPISADRYLLRMTLSRQAQESLERARALLRHQIPGGDAAAIVERALTLLVQQLERSKHARTQRPRIRAAIRASPTKTRSSRHVPAAVKRAVWARDAGRCAFAGMHGRCAEIGFLEYHHVVPFAAGGAATVTNLELRCRAHNVYETTLFEQSSERESLGAHRS